MRKDVAIDCSTVRGKSDILLQDVQDGRNQTDG